MLAKIAVPFSRFVQRYLPNSFSFAIILTFVTFALGILLQQETPQSMIGHWADGFWDFLTFGMQMAFIIITGFAVAVSKPMDRLLGVMAKKVKTGRQAVLWTMGISAVSAYFSWGLGLVLGPIFLRRLRTIREIDQPYLVAAGFAAAVSIIPMGLTVTVPLLVNTPGHFMEEKIGLIPLSETIFAPPLIITSLTVLIALLFLFIFMQPVEKRGELPVITADDAESETPAATRNSSQDGNLALKNQEKVKLTPAERVDNSKLLAWLIAAMGLFVVGAWFYREGLNLDINIVNFAFLFLGIALHGNLSRFLEAAAEGAKSAAGVIVQFPFYAGMMGMVVASGLAVTIAEFMTSVSTPETAGLLSFHATALLNLMVPSAGGGWGVQADVMIELANQHGIPHVDMVFAYTVGDMATNLLNPFFALAALGISGVKLGDTWGYALLAMVVYLVIGSAGVFFLPMIF